MPRRPRVAMGGYVFHVLNRAVGRTRLFEDDADYEAFVRVLASARQRLTGPDGPRVRVLGCCLMPNHWHLVLWPVPRKRGRSHTTTSGGGTTSGTTSGGGGGGGGDLSEFMRWLTVTHTQRWHAHRHSAGTGPVYQGRYKSFPVQTDEHFLTLMRYVESNACRAGLCERAEAWRWGSLAWRRGGWPLADEPAALDAWPVAMSRQWLRTVNAALSEPALARVRQSVRRGRPLGDDDWTAATARQLTLQSTLVPRGRPRKQAES